MGSLSVSKKWKDIQGTIEFHPHINAKFFCFFFGGGGGKFDCYSKF